MRYTVECGGRSWTVDIEDGRVLLDGRAVDVRLSGRPGEVVRRLVRGKMSRGWTVGPGDGPSTWRLSGEGERLEPVVLDERARAVRTGARGASGRAAHGLLKAPMPGLVVRVLVEAGAAVQPGQGLLVVEAMKMENELKASGPGTVAQVLVKPGDRVEKGAPLLELR